jgi:hypothetical protein
MLLSISVIISIRTPKEVRIRCNLAKTGQFPALKIAGFSEISKKRSEITCLGSSRRPSPGTVEQPKIRVRRNLTENILHRGCGLPFDYLTSRPPLLKERRSNARDEGPT